MTTVIGLTGSIGMGKSTTAQMFADEGLPVWDADSVVHKLYAHGGAAAQALQEIFPEAIQNGAVSRTILRDMISVDPNVMDHLQDVVHPLVASDRIDFIAQADADIVVLDVPLLFETGASDLCTFVVVVTATVEEQKKRVMSRGEMSEKNFQLILSRQMPDAEKRMHADYVIETLTLDQTRNDVRNVIADIRGKIANA